MGAALSPNRPTRKFPRTAGRLAIVSVAMAVMAYVPEESQAPLGWLYIAVGVVFVAILLTTVPRRRTC
jgi:hypothetical protein